MSMITYLASAEPLAPLTYQENNCTLNVWILDDRAWDIYTDKPYRAEILWDCTPELAKQMLIYIRKHLQTAAELELWHGWRCGDTPKILRYEAVLDSFTWEDIAQIDSLPVLSDPPVYHCVVIRKSV